MVVMSDNLEGENRPRYLVIPRFMILLSFMIKGSEKNSTDRAVNHSPSPPSFGK